MLVDFSTVLTNYKGETFTIPGGKSSTLGDTCQIALETNEQIPREEAIRRSKLAESIYLAKKPLDIPVDDVTLMLRLSDNFGPSLLRSIAEILDPKVEEVEKGIAS